MLSLLEHLEACGYDGACTNPKLLAWAIRCGAASEFYKDLVTWLEIEMEKARCTVLVRSNIKSLIDILRSSVLMKPQLNAAETVLNPREYRLQTLKLLVQQLVLSKKSGLPADNKKDESPSSDEAGNLNENKENLKIVLNTTASPCDDGGWRGRIVRFQPNTLEMFK